MKLWKKKVRLVLCIILFFTLLFFVSAHLFSNSFEIYFNDETAKKIWSNTENTIEKKAESEIEKSIETNILDKTKEACASLDKTRYGDTVTSSALSKLGNVRWRGSTLHVDIYTYTRNNNRKKTGGDVILITARQVGGDGKMTGYVNDHGNGTYTGVIDVKWRGLTNVNVILGAMIENVCLRLNALEKYENHVFTLTKGYGLRAYFRARNAYPEESTPCGPTNVIFGHHDVCNYTSLNDNLPWFCGEPKRNQYTCSNVYKFGTGVIDISHASKNEKLFFPTVQEFKDRLIVNQTNDVFSANSVSPCSKRGAIHSWEDPSVYPSGHWSNKSWRFEKCSSTVSHNVESYRKCLSKRTFYFIGDSTIRQYAEYFIKTLLDIKIKSLKGVGSTRTYRIFHKYTRFGINVTYITPEMPFHNPDLPPMDITSQMTEIRHLADSDVDDARLVILTGYHTHFGAFPIHVYRDRVLRLAQSLEYLFEKKPRARVFFKGHHFIHDDNRWFDSRITLVFQEIVARAFENLRTRVVYLDTWSITVIYGNNDVHPSGEAFTSQIQQLMSYLCS